MKTKSILVVLFLLVYSCKCYPQQHIFEPNNNDFRMTLYKEGDNGTPTSEGLLGFPQATWVGKSQGVYYRALYQWNIPDDVIPDNATIDSVVIDYLYRTKEGIANLNAQFYRIPSDISTNTDYGSMWGMFTDENKISEYSGVGSDEPGSIPVAPNFYGLQKLIDAVQNSLPENRFVLGIKSFTEYPQADDRLFIVFSGLVYLRVTYSLPQQSVRVTQILSNGNQYGNVGHFEVNSFIDRPTGTTYSLDIGSTEYFRADTNKATVADEKFGFWNYAGNVLNYNAFSIDSNNSIVTSYFNKIGTTTIRNVFEGSVSGGSIEFRDPWLRDDYSNYRGLRNRGSGAIWHSYNSPFVQDKSSTNFKGVLLNQTATTANSIFYSVKVPAVKDIYLSQLGRNQRFYFQNWTTTNATLTNPTNLETGYYTSPVVFTGNNAEVKANYKGTQLSNTQSAFSNTSQRKFIRTDNGYLHLVYESMNHIWYERSTDNGSSWQIMNGGKYLDQGATQSKLPSIATMYCISSSEK